MEHQSKVTPCGPSKADPFAHPLTPDLDFNGPIVGRHCTDWPWIGVFAVFNLGFLALCGYCYSCGEPDRLLHGWDFRGELCGTDALSARPYTYFPIPQFSLDVGLCLEGCPILATKNSVCYYDIDHSTDLMNLPCYASYTAKPFFSRYCLPADLEMREKVLAWLYRPQQVVSRITGDLYRAWDLIAISTLLTFSTLTTFLLWLYFGRFILALLALIIAALLSTSSLLCYFVYKESERVSDRICTTQNSVDMGENCQAEASSGYKLFALLLAGMLFVLLVAAAAQYRKVAPGVELISLAIQPLRNSYGLAGCVISAVLIGAGVFVLTVAAVVSAASCGRVERVEAVIPGWEANRLSFDSDTRGAIVFLLLMLVWWLSLLVHSVEYVTSYYTVTWFFSKDKARIDQPLRTALWTLFRFHLGSVLLSSLAFPMVRTPRAMLRVMYDIKARLSNDLEKCYASCCGLCLEIYSHYARFLNSHVLPYQALWGTSYLESAKRGFYLIARGHPMALGPVHAAEMHLWLCQLVLTLCGPLMVYIWVMHVSVTLAGEATLHITSVAGLAGTTLILSFFISEVFGGFMRGLVYGELVSYLLDKEMFSGVQRFSDISFSHMFHEEIILELQKKEAEKPVFTEESQQDLLEAVQGGKEQVMGKKSDEVTLSSQISMISDTSDEGSIRARRKEPMQRANSLVNADTVRNLQPAQLPPLPPSSILIEEDFSPCDSLSSYQESEVDFRPVPAARPPSRGDTTGRATGNKKPGPRIL